jgi:hypothetical protein
MSDHNLGVIFPKYMGLGPSKLLQASGSKSNLPKMGDYHYNLTKDPHYVKVGPGDYNLPSLFDNYNRNVLFLPTVKKNP